MRKLATIRKIDALNPIDGADAIECATVGGWKVVAQKGLYKEGDLAVYFEIDSWIPTEIAPFLSKGKEPREFEGVKGERLKTIKLRGQLSQGLLIPMRELFDWNEEMSMWKYREHPEARIETSEVIQHDGKAEITLDVYEVFADEGDDVSDIFNIKKWEKPINAQLAGVCKGNFPTLIPKTDQERVQNLKKEIAVCRDAMFEVTEKLEGSSMTVYQMKGEFGVCSRNMDLKETEGNSFWATARKDKIQEKMMEVDPYWDFAIQGELVGPGIQGNIYGLKEPEFRVFDVYNIQVGEYLNPTAREELIKRMGLKHVPILDDAFIMNDDVDGLLALAEGKSRVGDTEREGLVFKAVNGGITFKAISNKYLLGEK